MEILKINSQRGVLSVQWNDEHNLARIATPQAGCYFSNLDNVDWEADDKFLPIHDKYFKEWNQQRWSEREGMGVFDIPDNSTIVDIGCGAAITDLLLYSYVPGSKFYLVDKEDTWPAELHPAKVSYTVEHPFYNSWDPINDAITTSGFDKTRFNFLSPESSFPEDADLIMSSFSWCFHYPKENYWNKVCESLKTGGKLFLDVRLLNDRNIIDEISEEFKSEPVLMAMPILPEYLDNPPDGEVGIVGYRCLWTKNV